MFQELKADHYYDRTNGDTRLPFFLYAMAVGLAALTRVPRRLICRCRGHRYRDLGSFYGPEGAADRYGCSRCGAERSHTYF